MRFALAASSLLAAVIAATAACDLFTIACNDDDDCPGDVPFCVAGSCSVNEPPSRDGDGNDDNGCTEDSDCDALCYDVDDGSEFFGTCIPAAGDADCQAEVNGEPRGSDGPVIFAVDASPIGDGCYSVSLRFFDRQGDAEGGFFALVVDGAEQTQSVSIAGGTAGGTMCGAPLGTPVGVQMRDAAGNHSNVVCLPIAE